MGKQIKTNAMRQLERLGIAYSPLSYPHQRHQAVDGAAVAQLTGKDPERVFKTLVARSDRGEGLVFVIPVLSELDLKLAAKAAGAKSVAMLPLKELTALTGYERGGCSPIGMKKRLPTFIDRSAEGLPEVMVSAGQIGLQMALDPHELARAAGAGFFPLTRRN